MTVSSFVVTYTVKNESRLLPSGIEYHLAAGASKIYVFIDGSTDDTESLIARYDRVEVFATTKPINLDHLPKWIRDILPWWERDMDVRKRINTYMASKIAQSDGIEWLISIDPDEAVVSSLEHDEKVKFSIARMFESVADGVDQIFMRNLEVLPNRAEVDNPFIECTIFLNRFPLTEAIWRYSSALVRRITRFNPALLAWYDYLFYYLRFQNALPRLMRNLVTREYMPGSYFLGYSNFKSCIRVSRSDEFNFVIHKWIKFERSPRSICRGNVLHYDLFDHRYLAQKFGQRSSHMLLKDFYFRYMLAVFARAADANQIKSFFEKYISVSDVGVLNRLLRRKIAVRILTVQKFFLSKVEKAVKKS